jgi:CBS domain-containing protein
LGEVLEQAARHKGISFVEIYQNCVIFNPDEWTGLDDRRVRDDNMLYLQHGRPMIFGKNLDKGIRLNGFKPEVVTLGDGISEADLLVHDETSMELAFILSSMEHPQYPAPMGVIRRTEKPTYAEELLGQVKAAQAKSGVGDLNKLYRSADLWTVTPREETKSKKVTGMLPPELDEEYMDTIDQKTAETSAMQDRLTADPIAALRPKAPITIEATTSLSKAIRQMNSHNIGCLLVTDADDKLIGVFTERDVLMRVAGLVNDLSQAKVADYMTHNPVSLKSHLPIAQALHVMSIHGFRHLPLVDDNNRPEGIISFRDVVHYLKQSLT